MSMENEGLSINDAVEKHKANRAAQAEEASKAASTLGKLSAEKRREAQDTSEVIDSEESITEDDDASEELEAEDSATGTDQDGEASVEDGEPTDESEAEHDAEGPVNLSDHFGEDWGEAEQSYTIPYRENGQDKVATLKEAREALSKAGDYATRNADLKAERQKLEEKRAEEMQQLNGTVQTLTALHQGVVQSFAGSQPDRSLLDSNSENYNPDAYHLQLNVYNENLQKLQAYHQQLQAHSHQLQQQMRADMDKRKEAEIGKLRNKWATFDADWPGVKKAVATYLSDFGVSEEEFDQLPTAAAHEVVRLAAKQIETQSKVKDTKRQIKKLPKIRPNRPGQVRQPGEGERRAIDEQLARARKSGGMSVNDAVSIKLKQRDLARKQRRL